MVDYKGPKLIDEEGFPSKNGLNESVSLETLNFDSSSEDESFSDNISGSDENNSFKEKINVERMTYNLGNVINEVNRKIAYSTCTKQTNPIKLLVSKEKKRFNFDGFDLDLTYVTERIIAMGFPAENIESIYRNSMADVIKFFNLRHADHYRIYNLCSERKYKTSLFKNNVAEFPFEDHQAPSFPIIFELCMDMDEWLNKDEQNICAIHCKAGKGRTGVMICCYLLYSRNFTSAKDALKYYGMIRTKNRKGVTIPSQIRYVHYFQQALDNQWTLLTMPSPKFEIQMLKISPVPSFNVFGGSEPWFMIENNDFIYNSKKFFKVRYYKQEPFVEYNIENLIVQGDFLIIFYNNSLMNSKEKIFQCWLNTSFLDINRGLIIPKQILDKCCKDKSNKNFPKEFELELHGRNIKEKSRKGISIEGKARLSI